MGGIHSPRAVQDQDPDKASHEGRSEEHLRQGDEGRRKASQESRKGIPGCRLEEADLKRGAESQVALPEASPTWNFTGQAWKKLSQRCLRGRISSSTSRGFADVELHGAGLEEAITALVEG